MSNGFADQVKPIQVSQYRPWHGIALELPHPPYLSKEFIVLRRFQIGAIPHFLGVDPFSLRTAIEPDSSYLLTTISGTCPKSLTEKSPYAKLLKTIDAHDKSLSDVGLEEVKSAAGVVLTVDLCPSKKNMNRILIDSLIHAFPPALQPIPISFSISGAWIREHPQDLEWLKQKEQKGFLHITWINHSNRHRYVAGLPLQHDFMLMPGTDVQSEVLDAEKAMLAKGLLPSPFFRFPGLISNAHLVEQVLQLGLIPIGTDAWLAKKQQTHNGSIILIHGNGNEPLGVQEFLRILKERSQDIQKHAWVLLDLESSAEVSAHE